MTKKEVKSFLGLTRDYGVFIPGYAHIVDPLIELTRKGASNKLIWTPEHETAFVILEQHISKSPIQLAQDMDKEILLRSDASDRALGAVLLQ